MDTWDRIITLRREFLPDLEGFTPRQWDTASLCEQWRVRDVLAHTIHPERFSVLGLLGGVVRAGFSINRYIARDAIRRGSVPVPELLEAYRRAVTRRVTPPGSGPGHILADLLVHQQDIRRPLGLAWSHDAELLNEVAAGLHRHSGRMGTLSTAGVCLRATDTDWCAGRGDEVSGPAEALIMVMAGRGPALKDLHGPGVDVLAGRLAAKSPG